MKWLNTKSTVKEKSFTGQFFYQILERRVLAGVAVTEIKVLDDL